MISTTGVSHENKIRETVTQGPAYSKYRNYISFFLPTVFFPLDLHGPWEGFAQKILSLGFSSPSQQCRGTCSPPWDIISALVTRGNFTCLLQMWLVRNC